MEESLCSFLKLFVIAVVVPILLFELAHLVVLYSEDQCRIAASKFNEPYQFYNGECHIKGYGRVRI